MKQKQKDDQLAIPKWLRYLLIVTALLYLLWVLFFKNGVQRDDFPFFKRF